MENNNNTINSTNNRLLFIDNIRGIAFIFMVIQHLFYFYDVSKYYETNYASNPLISMSGTIARTIFIILSGYSLGLSYKSKKKKNRFKTPILVLTHAMLITCVTWFLYPEFYIRFGVLHYIGLSTLLLSFLAPYKNLYLISFIGSLILYILSDNLPKIKNILDLILGTGGNMYNMMDYFPLLKWLPYSIFGLYLFKINEPITEILNLKMLSNETILTNIGKNSLNYYTLHIIILLFFYKYLSLKE